MLVPGPVMWVGGAILAAALAWGAWAQWQLGSLHRQLGECRGEVGAVADAADETEASLVSCTGMLQRARQGIIAARESERKANEALELEVEELRDRAEAERSARKSSIESSGDCAAWAAEPVCPAIADSLRRAAGGDSD